jgi:hypothetical protein
MDFTRLDGYGKADPEKDLSDRHYARRMDGDL